MGRNRSEQVAVWLTPETKAEWARYVEESPEHSSLSSMIRTLVAREINTESGGSERPNPRGEAVDVGSTDLTPIMDRLDEIDESIARVDQRTTAFDKDLASIRENFEASTSEDIEELAMRVFDELPKSVAKAESLAAAPPEDGRDPDEPTGNPGELSERFNVPVSRINEAIERLEEDMPGLIDSTSGGTDSRYGHYYSG